MTISASFQLPPKVGGTLYLSMSAEDAAELVESTAKAIETLGESPALKTLLDELTKVLTTGATT